MSINNFRSVRTDAEGALILAGQTLDVFGGSSEDLGDGANIRVAIIAVDDESKRCEPVVPHPGTTPWQAKSPPGHSFSSLESVYAVGAATTATGALFLWTQQFVIDGIDIEKDPK